MKNNYQLKVGFQTPLQLHKVPNKTQLWQVDKTCRYYSALTNEVYTIPKRYYTDFATIPKAFQWFLPPDGEYAWETCLHDLLYDKVAKGFMERKTADDVFKEAMSVGKVTKWKEVVLYRAVRMFGGVALKYF